MIYQFKVTVATKSLSTAASVAINVIGDVLENQSWTAGFWSARTELAIVKLEISGEVPYTQLKRLEELMEEQLRSRCPDRDYRVELMPVAS